MVEQPQSLSYKINLDVLNLAAPPVEPENFVRKVDHLLCRQVMYFAATLPWAR